jgi:two-component system sensor histidine kinase KdpD
LPWVWAWQWREVAVSVAVVVCTAAVFYIPWAQGWLSTTATATGIMGATLIMALQMNALSTVIAGLVGLLAYVFLLITPNYNADSRTFLGAGEVIMLLSVSAVALVFANLRTLKESRFRVQEQHTRALLRFVHDTSYAENAADIIKSALIILRRDLGLYVVYGQVAEDGVAIRDNVAIEPAEHKDMMDAVHSGSIVAPSQADGFIWCPIQAGYVVLAVIGIKHSIQSGLQTNHALVVFLRTFTRLFASALWRVQLEQDRSESKFLANRETLRSSLLASVSHDLKTPLASIIGSLSTLVMAKDKLPQTERQALTVSAYHEAERLHRIVHNVLEMAKLESGSLVPRKEFVDIADVVKVVAERVKKAYPHFNITMQNNLNGAAVLGDELLISQVVYNLLDNAAKYGPVEHEARVVLSNDDNFKYVNINIADQGQGIDPNDLTKVFDKFYRSSFTDQKQAGSGLGLAICRAMVEAHGGTIEASLRTDGHKGMVFSMHLPAAEVPKVGG